MILLHARGRSGCLSGLYRPAATGLRHYISCGFDELSDIGLCSPCGGFITRYIISSRRALWLLWSPPSAGQTASCCSTPSHNASASWMSLDIRNSLTKQNRVWVGNWLIIRGSVPLTVTSHSSAGQHIEFSVCFYHHLPLGVIKGWTWRQNYLAVLFSKC